jgi:hypothetical protein
VQVRAQYCQQLAFALVFQYKLVISFGTAIAIIDVNFGAIHSTCWMADVSMWFFQFFM